MRLADKLKASTIVLAPHPHEFLDSLYHQSVSTPAVSRAGAGPDNHMSLVRGRVIVFL